MGWKGYIILAVIAIFLLVGFLQVQSAVCDRGGGSNEPEIIIPSKTVAPYIVDTYSRVYLAREATKDNETGDVTMSDYWEMSGDDWVEHDITFVLEAETYGEIKIKKR